MFVFYICPERRPRHGLAHAELYERSADALLVRTSMRIRRSVSADITVGSTRVTCPAPCVLLGPMASGRTGGEVHDV